MRTPQIRICKHCGKRFVVFLGKGRIPKNRCELVVRASNALTCSMECSKASHKTNDRRRR